MADYTLTQTAAVIDATLVKSGTYVPKSFVTVADITARNAIASGDKTDGKIVKVLDDGTGNVAYYSWNAGGASWDNATFPPEDGSVSSSSLDSDLYDEIYTPSYLSETTVTQAITSLVSTALKSRLDATFYGVTSVNLLEDDVAGCESTSGWSASNCSIATDSGNKYEGVYSLKITSTASTSCDAYRNILSLLDSSKYYLIAGHVNNSTFTSGMRVAINCVGGAGVIQSSLSTASSFTALGIVIQPSDFSGASAANLFIQGVGTVGQLGYFDALVLKEITASEYAEGASATLTKYPYHRGLKSSEYTRVKSIGKNLIKNGNGELGIQHWLYDHGVATLSSVNDGGLKLTTTGSNGSYKQDFKLAPNTNYYLNFTDDTANGFTIIFGRRGATFTTLLTNTGTFNSSTYDDYRIILRNTTTGTTIFNNLQLEIGSSATTYEAYTETSAYAPVILRSDNGSTQDTFNLNTGLHTQKVSNFTVSTITGVINGTNVTRAYIGAFTDNDTWLGNDSDIHVTDADGNAIQRTTSATFDNVSEIGKYYVASNQYVYFIVTLGTSQPDAQTALAGYKMHYKLKEPIETLYFPNVINSEPSGTIYVEPVISDYDFYDSGCVVNDVNYPISSLDYVSIVDKSTGALTPVSISSCTIASDGLSFTSTAIAEDDLVNFGYHHLYLSTIPTLAYSYSENLKGCVDGNRKDIAELDEKVEQLIIIDRTRLKTINLVLGSISATTTQIAFVAPYNCRLTSCKIVTKDAITASDTDYWTIALTDKGSDGSGSDTIASKDTKATGGEGFTAYDAWDIGELDDTYKKLSAGDVVILTLTKTASATAFAEALAVLNYLPE